MLLGKDEMISRAGKFTDEIHMILKHKQEIINGEPRKLMYKSQSAQRIDNFQEKVSNLPLLSLKHLLMGTLLLGKGG